MRPLKHGSGFTLIELMTTLAVAAILLVLAAPSFLAFKRNSELTSATNDLVAAISAAKGEALKRGLSAVVIPATGTDWNTGWTAFVDTNNDQLLNATETPVFQQAAMPSYINITGQATGLASLSYIMFNSSGYSSTAAAIFQSVTLRIQRTDVSSAEQSNQTRIVIVSKSGRVRACNPSSDTTCTTNATE